MYTGKGPDITQECTEALKVITKHFTTHSYQTVPVERAIEAAFILEAGIFCDDPRKVTTEEKISLQVAIRELKYFLGILEDAHDKAVEGSPLIE